MDGDNHARGIVVAEDHVFQRRVLRHQISSLGYHHILEASSGDEALALCRQGSIDLLFCDLRMPGMDGMALLRHLSLLGFRGGIIISSALENDVIDSVLLMGKAYGLRMLGSIRKPASARQIESLLSLPPEQAHPRFSESAPVTVDDLRRALDSGLIGPWYQPKLSFKTGEWLGTEALARWHHPDNGFISPAVFIPLAEAHGLIDQLTDVMLSRAMRDGHLWAQSGLSINLSMNISPHSLLNGDLCDRLLSGCRQWGISPGMVTLEVTEGAFIEDVGRSLEMLTRMRMHGFGLSIDDFGTGYSSVQQLTMLPFTELKLDRSFISRCCLDAPSMAVVEYSLKLAQRLGLRSVAEGVEDARTWHALAELGCDMCQGYFSARPMPEHELAVWHQKWKSQVRDQSLVRPEPVLNIPT